MDGGSSAGILTLGLCREKGGTREITQQLMVTWSKCLARNLLFKGTQRRQPGSDLRIRTVQ